MKCNLEGREYKIFGYKGKQVRDNIHSLDVARFMAGLRRAPRAGEVYNLGGGQGEQRIDPGGVRPDRKAERTARR